MKRSEAIRLREIVEQAMDGTIDDATALEAPNLFKSWSENNVEYKKDIRVRYIDGNLYRCLITHISQPDWNPVAAPSLWAKVLIPDENVIPDWEQPDSTNGYNYGDKVRHNGIIWISIFDGSNIWEPGTAGTENLWKEYIEVDSESNGDTEYPNIGGGGNAGSDSSDGESGENNFGNSEEDDSSIDTDEEDIIDWVQPTATNGYSIGDKVRHNDCIWISKLDNNVYEPSAAAWAAWEQIT